MANKFLNKLKKSVVSIVIAVAMLLSFSYSFIFSVAAVAKTSNAVYYATETKDYTFSADTSNFNSMTTNAGDSSKYSINRSATLINLTTTNNYYPIAKYNGITTLSDDRTEEIKELDTVDNYAALIATNDYSVTRKVYTTDKDNNYIYETNGDKAIIYVGASQQSGETQTDYETRIGELSDAIDEINSKIAADSDFEYRLISIEERTSASFYNDYTQIGTETDEYSSINEQISELDLAVEISEKTFALSDFTIYHKKTFTYEENSIYFRTSSNITLASNSYYALSAWVYTAGDASATVCVSGTNLEAKIENVQTQGKWTQVYLFISSRATASTSVYVYLYYGDTTGVTGTEKNVDDYSSSTMTGTVVFDNVKLIEINYTDFVNQTINGYDPETIAKANFAEGYDYTNIVNNSKAVVSDDNVTYTEAKYNSNYDGLVAVESFTSRYYKTFENFDANFQSSLTKTTTDSLVYMANDTAALNFDTYLNNNTKYFSYYMPRYTSDTSTTFISGSTKQAYRTQYATLYNNEINGTDYKFISVVAENTEFEGYSKDDLDPLGNIRTEEVDGQTQNKQIKNVHNNTFSANGDVNYILKVNNTSSFDLGVTSSSFTIPALAFYRVSVFVYSADKDATATVKLFSTISTKDSAKFGTLVLTNVDTTEFEYNDNNTNGWKEVTFFVKGNPTTDVAANLALIASANSTVYFDNITIEAVNSSAYSSASNKVDLSTYGILSSNIKNGNFESISVTTEGDLAAYPYTAENWTIDDSTSSNVIKGIISTRDSAYENTYVPLYEDGEVVYYEDDEITSTLVYGEDYLLDYQGKYVKTTTIKEMFGNYDAPTTTIYGQTLTRENVYAVYMPQAAAEETDPSFLMKSASIGYSKTTSSLNSKAVYKLTYQVWLGDNFSGTVYSELKTGSNTLSQTSVDASSIAKGAWQTITYYVRTGLDSRSSITLTLGAKESHGTMFIQNVNIVALADKTDGNVTTSVDDQFVNLKDSNTNNLVRFVDLLSNDFTMHADTKNTDTNLYDSYSYTLTTKESSASYTQGTIGVIKVNDSFAFNEEDIVVLRNNNSTSDSYLLIKNDETTDYSVVNSVTTNTLASSSFYKITVDVKTNDMGDNGLTITAKGFEEQNAVISNINTKDYTENNGYKTYTFYLRTGSSSVSSYALKFELGKSSNSFTGWALVSNIQVETLTEDEYTTVTTSEETKADKSINIASKYVEESSDSSSSSSTAASGNFSWQTFFLVFSSILLVVSLIVALVAVIVKRNKKNKPEEPTNNKPDESGAIK